MCGVTGFLDRRAHRTADDMAGVVTGMTVPLSHRGPDDAGIWVDAPTGVAFGHRRLAIIDLSDAGKQPMVSAGGRHVLTYNGEIYNARELQRELSGLGCRFRGHSDTEVLLAAIERWGTERALLRVNGMFAFAVWDRELRRLQLARDRLGEKPMYYGWTGQTFLFGSELKALRAHPDFSPEIDRGALALYFRHNCVPAPHCIYAGLSKLPPGTVLTVDAAQPAADPVPVPYWSARDMAEAGAADPLEGSSGELADRLEALLLDAVGIRMQADVPLGAFLSGGVDSSTVVALMQAQSARKVKTFTIGFDDAAYDESDQAAGVAAHLGTDHVSVSLRPADAIDTIARLPDLYDEPFSDSSQIPTFLVSQLARRDVTVSLSGDGGDELFAGYNRYTWGPSIWNRIRRMPPLARSAAAAVLRAPSPETWDRVFQQAAPLLPPRLRVRYPGMKIDKLAGVVPSSGLDDMYRRLTSHDQNPTSLVLEAVEPITALTDGGGRPALGDPVATMMYLDLITYLPDDILVKLDRASMGVSLEARVPMLDHRVVEFAWRVPLEMKLRAGQGKWLLREVLHRHVPRELVDRPKAGFGLPVGDWLRGPLRGWAEDLLGASRLRQEGFLDVAAVRALWAGHLGGRGYLTERVWDVLMFQSWLESSSRSVVRAAAS